MGLSAEQELLKRMGADFEVLDSGCCGMAGSFGFEKDHYDVSVKIGERRLLPAVREAPKETIVLADGFSCKTQVEELTERRPLHLAQLMLLARDQGPEGPTGGPPERDYPDVEPPDSRRAILAGGAALAAAAAAAGAVTWLRGRR